MAGEVKKAEIAIRNRILREYRKRRGHGNGQNIEEKQCKKNSELH